MVHAEAAVGEDEQFAALARKIPGSDEDVIFVEDLQEHAKGALEAQVAAHDAHLHGSGSLDSSMDGDDDVSPTVVLPSTAQAGGHVAVEGEIVDELESPGQREEADIVLEQSSMEEAGLDSGGSVHAPKARISLELPYSNADAAQHDQQHFARSRGATREGTQGTVTTASGLRRLVSKGSILSGVPRQNFGIKGDIFEMEHVPSWMVNPGTFSARMRVRCACASLLTLFCAQLSAASTRCRPGRPCTRACAPGTS
jgi:hypothetical protein